MRDFNYYLWLQQLPHPTPISREPPTIARSYGITISLLSEPCLSPCDTWGSGPAGRWNCRGGRRRGPPWSRAAVAEVENAGFPGREIRRGRRRIWPRQPRARAPPPPWASDQWRGGRSPRWRRARGGTAPAWSSSPCSWLHRRGSAAGGAALEAEAVWSSCPCWYWPHRRGSAASWRRRDGCEPPREPTAVRAASRMEGWMRATAGNARLPSCG
jgi:hypothetical protein